MKKQIVFINQSSGYLMIDIVNSFKEKYDERVLMTGLLAERNFPLDKEVRVEWLKGYVRNSTFKRLLTWLLAFLKAVYLINVKYRNAHLFIVSNPPFAPLIPLFCKNSFDLLIYDIYPDALYEFKIIKKDSMVVRLWEKANVKVFRKANKVYTITEQMKVRLGRYVSSDLISVVPIWTDNEFLKPIPKSDNFFLKEQGLQDKFVVLYSGNLGKSHPVEVLVDIARDSKENGELFFLIIGQGDKWGMIKKLIQKSELKNIRLLPWQPIENFPYSLSCADISMVSIGNEASELAIPSKTYNFMSVGVPILCVAKEDSALSKLIKQHNNGVVFSAIQKDEIRNFIYSCQSNSPFLNHLKKNSIEASLSYTSVNVEKFHIK